MKSDTFDQPEGRELLVYTICIKRMMFQQLTALQLPPQQLSDK